MKIRTGFVTNSSSTSFTITGIKKLKALSEQQLRKLCDDDEDLISECKMLRGEEHDHKMYSGDESCLELDLGDKQYWSISYGSPLDDADNIAILETIGMTLDGMGEGGFWELLYKISTMERLGALVVYNFTESEFEKLKAKAEEERIDEW